MKLERIQLSELISPKYNPRVINDDEFNKLKNSLKEFGYCDPLIVNDVNNHIVGGNQRYFALKELGYTEADVIYIHEPDTSKEKGLNIALNKISGDWDYPKLNELLDELMMDTNFDITLTGFDNLELTSFDDELDNLDLGDLGTGDPILHQKATLIIDSEDPDEINELYDRLTDEGYDCRIK